MHSVSTNLKPGLDNMRIRNSSLGTSTLFLYMSGSSRTRMGKTEASEARCKAEDEINKCMGFRLQSLMRLKSNRSRIHVIIITTSGSRLAL